MILLGLDTSGTVCSVAVGSDERILAQFTIQNKKTHSQTLMPLVDAAVERAGIAKGDIDAIVISEGPGSFTGLRIGAATTKALSLALDVPVIAVPTLAALACNVPCTDRIVCPLMDARRAQVYAAAFFQPDTGAETNGVPKIPVTRIAQAPYDIREFLDMINALGAPAAFLGDGVSAYRDAITKEMNVPYEIVPMQYDHQDAASAVYLAARFLADAKEECAALGVHAETADSFVPVYLRPAQAERESVILRPMEEADVESAHALECASFTRPWTTDMFRAVVSDADSIAVVAVIGEKQGALQKTSRVVGTAFLKMVAGEGTVTNVNVDRDFRRQGIGEAMMDILLEEGRAAGVSAFTLEVRFGNTAARRLYEKCGFVSEGVRPGFYEDPKEDAEIYWLRND